MKGPSDPEKYLALTEGDLAAVSSRPTTNARSRGPPPNSPTLSSEEPIDISLLVRRPRCCRASPRGAQQGDRHAKTLFNSRRCVCLERPQPRLADRRREGRPSRRLAARGKPRAIGKPRRIEPFRLRFSLRDGSAC